MKKTKRATKESDYADSIKLINRKILEVRESRL